MSHRSARTSAGIAVFGLSLILLPTQSAYAYIDPGSGSVITAAIIGFFTAISYTVRKYYYKLRGAPQGSKRPCEVTPVESETDEPGVEERKE